MLASGDGSNLQALLDATTDPEHGPDFGAEVVAVGADRHDIEALARAERHGVETFVLPLDDFDDRPAWDVALADRVAGFDPDLVVLAGFMKLTGPAFLALFGGRTVNTHPALLPSFPGMHGPRDALAHGVKITGATVFVVDSGVDTGPIVAQTAVPVLPDDDESSLRERIKVSERQMLVDTIGRMVREGYSIDHRTFTFGAS